MKKFKRLYTNGSSITQGWPLCHSRYFEHYGKYYNIEPWEVIGDEESLDSRISINFYAGRFSTIKKLYNDFINRTTLINKKSADEAYLSGYICKKFNTYYIKNTSYSDHNILITQLS